MATAEFAVAIPAILLMLVVALSAVATVADQVRCTDAARATARLVARGDPSAAAVGQGRQLAPARAQISVLAGPGTVEVTVTGHPAAALAWMGSRVVPRGRAVAALEEQADRP